MRTQHKYHRAQQSQTPILIFLMHHLGHQLIFLFFLLLMSNSKSAVALQLSAQDASVKTNGGIQQGVWNLWSNGMVGDYVEFKDSGRYRLIVEAKGTPVANVWPQMAVTVDITQTAVADVTSPEFSLYTFPLQIEAGVHKLAISFTNDKLTGDEDRNLYLKRLTILPLEGQDNPIFTNMESWRSAFKRKQNILEAQLLVNAQNSIEKIRKEDARVVVVDMSGKTVKGVSVYIEQRRHAFLFGGNIFRFDRLKTKKANEIYKQRFSDLFNFATTGFYWLSYEQQRNKPNYAYTDNVVNWCQENGIRVKGHPLLWDAPAGKPRWSGDILPTPELLQKRVLDLLQRYSGKIDFWDVVNEPSHLTGLKIDEPYHWARVADPTASLIVNDFEVFANGYPNFYSLLQEAILKRVPFDGIGIQAHEPQTMRFSLTFIQKILDKYATLGKEIHITEFSPTSGGQQITGSHIKGMWDERAQAEYAEKFYTLCYSHPAVAAITWWDLTDNGSWLEGGGLLRRDLSPKPVYNRLKKLIHEVWKTTIKGETDENGTLRFRGYLGRYTLVAEYEKKRTRLDFDLVKGDSNTLIITLQ